MAPLPHGIAHKHHLSLRSLVSMTTIMAPTHHHTTPSPATPTLPYLTHPIQEHLRTIYTSLCGPSPLLSRAVLGVFLNDVQRQDISLPEDMKEYTFEEWLALLWMSGSFEAVAALEGETDLGKPISSYFISSSHNTYLSGNQLLSKSTTDAYKNVLIRGCRCIEIDVHNGEPLSPSAHRSYVTGTTPSELVVSAKLAKDKYKSKYKSKYETEYKSKIESLKGHIPWRRGGEHKERAATEIERKEETGHSLGHRKTASDVPSITRERTSDSDGSDDLEDDDVVNDSTDNGSARNRSSSIAKGEPIVLHAWTLTRYVGFREVCRAVREAAFVTTNLPLIVSLQVGCDLEQQEVMVQIMKEEWADLLIDTAHPTCPAEERVPRLDELLNKILVKVKRSTEVPQSQLPSLNSSMTASSNPTTPLSPSTTLQHPSTLTPSVSVPSTPLTPTTSHDALDNLSNSSGSRSPSRSRSRSPAPKLKNRIHPSLSALGIYTHSAHFSSLSAPSASTPSHIYSLSEGDILELHAASPQALLAHNRNYLMRVYPSGLRVDSSNPDPSVFWRKGVQMAALNWQAWDAGTMLNEAMFADSDGWVLKPPELREDGVGPSDEQKLDGTTKSGLLGLQIKIFAAQRILGDQELRARVKVELHAERVGEKAGEEWKRHTESRRGKSVDWKGECLDFSGAGPGLVEELSFVRFRIEDDGFTDKLAAWACVRLDRLHNGYRFLKLRNAKGRATDGLLFVGVERTQS